jgi:hypothetical protein
MTELKAHPANVPGDFYVEDGCCTMCGVPFAEAPELFGTCRDSKGYPHCFVKRQPETTDELAKMLSTIRLAELMCIRYRGTDRRIQLDLVEADSGTVCDALSPEFQQRVNDQVSESKRIWEEMHTAQVPRRAAPKPWWKFWG